MNFELVLKNETESRRNMNRADYYQGCIDSANIARAEGDHRDEATFCREAVFACPSKWEHRRYVMWTRFVSLVFGEQEEPRVEFDCSDIVAFKHFANDRTNEPFVMRVDAFICLGSIMTTYHHYESVLGYTIRAQCMLSSQDMLSELHSISCNDDNGLAKLVEQNVSRQRETVSGRIKLLQDPVYACEQHGVPHEWNGKEKDDLVKRLLLAGLKCDCCGKSHEDVAGEFLSHCSRCKQAYYCSTKCQRTMWKGGHKQACRMCGQIEVGDYMLLWRLQNRPELNGKLVRVCGPTAARPGRWDVVVLKLDSHISVAADKLVCIRPET